MTPAVSLCFLLKAAEAESILPTRHRLHERGTSQPSQFHREALRHTPRDLQLKSKRSTSALTTGDVVRIFAIRFRAKSARLAVPARNSRRAVHELMRAGRGMGLCHRCGSRECTRSEPAILRHR